MAKANLIFKNILMHMIINACKIKLNIYFNTEKLSKINM